MLPEEVANGDSGRESGISEQDLYRFLAGKCDDAVRSRIVRQMEIPNSPIRQWLSELDARLATPLDVDWTQIAVSARDNEGENEREVPTRNSE